MSRVCGLVLIVMGVWEFSVGLGPAVLVLLPIGLYLMLRGGGAWAMDIYVQKMQDRVRRREQQALSSPESS
jgi:hypothetical protein